MSDLVSRTQQVLLSGRFTIRLSSLDDVAIVVFEDEVVSGFACIFDNVEQMLERWHAVETALLTRYATRLRTAGDKSWNIYCVFLTASAAEPEQIRQVAWIEENLSRTRKIAACDLTTRERLTNALLPVLPLQNQPDLGADDVADRLIERIRQVSGDAASVYLDESVPPLEVARLLLGGDS